MRVWAAAAGLALAGACMTPSRAAAADAEDRFAAERERMVEDQIEAREISDPRVLSALRSVARHEFVPAGEREHAYEDRPLPIGHGQTISQPYIVAVMSELLHLRGSEKVLEVGTGSGYQAAVLARLAREVYTIEIVPELARRAEADLRRLAFANVHVRAGDGYRGWPEQAPFDAILVTAAPGHVPQPLVDQLAIGGRMVLPVGDVLQELVLVTRDERGVRQQRLIGVRFVPMTGEAQRRDEGGR